MEFCGGDISCGVCLFEGKFDWSELGYIGVVFFFVGYSGVYVEREWYLESEVF